MAYALGLLGYETPLLPPPEADQYEIQRLLDRLLKSVADCDTLVIYFAGHAFKDGRNRLKLILGEDLDEDKNQLDAVKLVDDLREKCPRTRKLLLLDCCNAGNALQGLDWDRGNLAVLAATAERDSAREFTQEELQGFLPLDPGDGQGDPPFPRIQGAGFFTWNLIHALAERPHHHCNPQGEVRIGRVAAFLKEQAGLYNLRGSHRVAEPRLYECDKDIPVAVLKTQRPTGFPFELTATLRLY
jgi:uncharacterized caspase-like protein